MMTKLTAKQARDIRDGLALGRIRPRSMALSGGIPREPKLTRRAFYRALVGANHYRSVLHPVDG